MIRNFYIFWLLFFFSTLSGQHSLRFKRVNVNHGLSQNTVICITQDHNGFMWMGTQDGLNRYDGYSFKVYRQSETDSNSLSNNYVISIAVDKKGNIWAGTTNGLNRIDGQTGRLSRVNLRSVMPTSSNFRVPAMVASEDGSVYFTTTEGMFYTDTNGNLNKVNELQSHPIYWGRLFFADEHLWATCADSILSYDLRTKKITVRKIPEVSENTKLVGIRDQIALLMNRERLYEYDLKNGKFKRVYSKYIGGKEPRNIQSTLMEENDQWIATETGLLWKHGDDTLLIRNIADYEFSLSSDYVYCVFKDRSGLYWIGTSRGGFCIFNPAWQNFKIIGKPTGVTVPVWNICEKSDTLFLATTKGVRLYKRRSSKRVSDYLLPEQALTEIFLPPLQTQFTDKLVTAVCLDEDNNLWIGSENEGVFLYNFRTKKTKHFYRRENDSTYQVTNKIHHIAKLQGGKVGVSTTVGYCIIDIRTHQIRNIFLSNLNPKVNNSYIIKTTGDGDNIWFSSAHGLCRLNTRTNQLDQFLPDQNQAEQYHNIISDIKKDKENRYWVSTLGYGLLQFDPEKASFKRFSTSNGLKNETIRGFLIDHHNDIWLGTHEGIARFNASTEQFVNFGLSEGLDSKECTENGFYKSETGDLLFGTMSGLVVFDPVAVEADARTHPTILTGIKINYANIGEASQYITKGNNFSPEEIHLDYKVKTISFDFATLRFLNTDNVSYKYKLEGFNEQWVNVNAAGRSASYTNLSPGTYTFMVVPVVNNSDLLHAGLQFVVKMSPPYWRTWWFILIVLNSSILLVVFVVRYYSQRKLRARLRQAEEENRLQKEKERISRELHDNVGSQLTYIIKSLDNLSYKSGNEAPQIGEHLDALGDFSRDTLNQLRESIWAINAKAISLNELLVKINEYTNKLNGSFEKTRIRLRSTGDLNIELKPGVAINCFRILQEAVINSLKYANAGLIEISIRNTGREEITFEVVDNGQGFETQTVKGRGYGLRNMDARAKEMGTNLLLESGPGKGTVIRFSVNTR